VWGKEVLVSEKIRDMVEDTRAHSGVNTAKNMPDAANAEESLLGYAAVNDTDDDVARRAFQLYQERQEKGLGGSADDDWFRAEQEVRRNRGSLNA
jgi:hypothetical protein